MRSNTVFLLLIATLLSGCMKVWIDQTHAMTCEDMFGPDHASCASNDSEEGS